MTKITEKSTINFWQPLEIEVDPKFNRLQKALVNIGVFADQYLSLSDYKVSWTSRV